MGRAQDPYPSRIGVRVDPISRRDPVVWGEAPEGPLSPEDVERYEQDGFLFLPALFTEAEMAGLEEEGRRLARELPRDTPGLILEPGRRAVRSLFRLHRRSEVFRRFCSDGRIRDVGRQLLGSETAILQSRINYKPAFYGEPFPWHSDFETWHCEDGLPRMRTLSASVNLTGTNQFNGPLMLIPGSHRIFVPCTDETPEENYRRSLVRQEVGVPDLETIETLHAKGGIVAPSGPPGSVLFFDCNLMHGSGGNISPWPRNNLFLVMNSIENPLEDPFSARSPRPEFLAERV